MSLSSVLLRARTITQNSEETRESNFIGPSRQADPIDYERRRTRHAGHAQSVKISH